MVALEQLSSLREALENRKVEAGREAEVIKLRVQIYIRLGSWELALFDPKETTLVENSAWNPKYDKVLQYLETATQLDPDSYQAWHEWALMNFRATEVCLKTGRNDKIEAYVAPAVNGFFRSILLGSTKNDVTKDVLRLLTLWFANCQ